MRGRTDTEWLRQLGDEFRVCRIDADLTRDELARLASVSVRSIGNLELGHGSTFKTAIRILRALGRTDWLLELADTDPQVSPIAALRAERAKSKLRQRVAKRPTTPAGESAPDRP